MAARALLLLLLAPLAALPGGCAPDMRMAGSGPSREISACARSGGFLDTRGRRQTLMCVHRYADAGKACASRSDCEGKCIAAPGEDGLPAAGMPVAGWCQADDRLFGCYAEVENGKVRSSICVD